MSGIEDIPVIGGIAETAIHGVEAAGHAVEGDWNGAADEAMNMAGSAAHSALDLATDGIGGTVLDAAEGVYDSAAHGLGLPDSGEIWGDVKHGVEDVGNALGDGAYNLVHGDDDTSGLGGGGLDLGGGGDGGLGGGDLGGGLGGGDYSTESQGDAGSYGGDYGAGGGSDAGAYDMSGADGAEY